MLILLGILGLVIVGAAFNQYLTHIGFSVMAGSAEWGQFGDFIGGTTNPLLSLLTFLGVLYTIHQNNMDRKENKRTQKKEETYRVIETIFNQIELCLESLEF